MDKELNKKIGSTSWTIGRIAGFLALIALVCAWMTEITNKSILGMDQQHLFFDSIALSLIGIGSMIDALLHSKIGKDLP